MTNTSCSSGSCCRSLVSRRLVFRRRVSSCVSLWIAQVGSIVSWDFWPQSAWCLVRHDYVCIPGALGHILQDCVDRNGAEEEGVSDRNPQLHAVTSVSEKCGIVLLLYKKRLLWMRSTWQRFWRLFQCSGLPPRLASSVCTRALRVRAHRLLRYPLSIPPPSQNKVQIGLNYALFGPFFGMRVIKKGVPWKSMTSGTFWERREAAKRRSRDLATCRDLARQELLSMLRKAGPQRKMDSGVEPRMITWWIEIHVLWGYQVRLTAAPVRWHANSPTGPSFVINL